jgi:hypothetical protein
MTERTGGMPELLAKFAPSLKHAGPSALTVLLVKFDTPGKALLLLGVYFTLNVLQLTVNPALRALGKRFEGAIEPKPPKDRRS